MGSKTLRSWLAAAVAATVVVGVGGSAEDAAPAAGRYVSVTPTRIADTNSGLNTSATPIAAGSPRAISVVGVAGVPTSGVNAVLVDVAVTSATSTTQIRVGASDASEPDVGLLAADSSSPNASNSIAVAPGADGKIKIWNRTGNADVNVDIQGYFSTTATSGTGGFVPVEADRIASSPAGTGFSSSGLRAASTKYTVQAAGIGDVPSNATAIFANVRVLNASANGGLRVGPSSATFTNSSPSQVNYQPDRDNSSGTAIKLGSDGKIAIWGSTSYNVTIDVQGYFVAGSDGSGFVPLTSGLIYDSRENSEVAIPGGGTREVVVGGKAGIPDDFSVEAVAMTLRVMDTTGTGNVTVFDPDDGTAPGTVSIGYVSGEPVSASSSATMSMSEDLTVAIRNNSSNSINIAIGAQGYYVKAIWGLEELSGPQGPAPVDDWTTAEKQDAANQTAGQDAAEAALGEYNDETITKAQLDQKLSAASSTAGYDLSGDYQPGTTQPSSDGATPLSYPQSPDSCSTMPASPTMKTSICGGSWDNPVGRTVEVKWVGQPTSYYCGPATATMILRTRGLKSQRSGKAAKMKYLAGSKYLNTDNAGSTDWGSGNRTDNMMWAGLVSWIYGDKHSSKGKSVGFDDKPTDGNFFNFIRSHANKLKPVAVGTLETAASEKLYNEHPVSRVSGGVIRHWIVARGYRKATSQTNRMVFFADPSARFYTYDRYRVNVDKLFISYEPSKFNQNFVKTQYGVVG